MQRSEEAQYNGIGHQLRHQHDQPAQQLRRAEAYLLELLPRFGDQGWLQHQIVFEHRPLGEVAAEFNRYARTPLEVEDARLAALPISGSFDADDMEAFVAYVERLPGTRLRRTETRIRVLGESTAN